MIMNNIFFSKNYDYSKRNMILGNLSEKQLLALSDCARLSPDYSFEVVQYAKGPTSAATHVKIWNNKNTLNHVALAGKHDAAYYDCNPETKKTLLRVCHRVYHRSCNL